MDFNISALEQAKGKFIEQIARHPFLQRCREGDVSDDELKTLLVQQGLYGSYFTRYLCALMANLPSNADVLKLAENLFEELGFEEGATTPHHVIYREMLQRFDLSLDGARPTRGTQGLITAMLQSCKHPNPAVGLGAICLGAEALVPPLYSDLIRGFEARGYHQADYEFFRIHVECDDGHAETIRDIMAELARKDPQQLDIMIAAGQSLVDARWRFFDDCLERAGATAQVA